MYGSPIYCCTVGQHITIGNTPTYKTSSDIVYTLSMIPYGLCPKYCRTCIQDFFFFLQFLHYRVINRSGLQLQGEDMLKRGNLSTRVNRMQMGGVYLDMASPF